MWPVPLTNLQAEAWRFRNGGVYAPHHIDYNQSFATRASRVQDQSRIAWKLLAILLYAV